MDMSEFKNRLQYLYDQVVGSEKMAGVDRVYFPGELEQICAKVSARRGLDVGLEEYFGRGFRGILRIDFR